VLMICKHFVNLKNLRKYSFEEKHWWCWTNV